MTNPDPMNTTQAQRILMVDENAFLLMCYTEFLQRHGYTVHTADHRRQARHALDEFKPDLVVLDISPATGGAALLKALADHDQRLRLPVIVFSERDELSDFAKGFHGARFLRKTGYGELLLEAIRESLPPPAVASATEPSAEAPPGGAPTGDTQTRVPAAAPDANHHILIADDDPRNLDDLRWVLGRAGYQTTVVENGPMVIEKAPLIKPGLILVKNLLPGLNGGILARHLKRIPETATIPVVVYDDSHGRENLHATSPLRALADGSVVPTSDARTLLRCVEHLVGRPAPPATGSGTA